MSHEKWGHWQFWVVFGLKKVLSYWLKSRLAHRVKAQHVTSNETWNEAWRNVLHDWDSGSHPGRQGARCVSWPARVRADSRAGSSPSRQSRNGRGSPRGWRRCSRVPPRCPSSNWGRNIQAENSDLLEMLGMDVASLVMFCFLFCFFFFAGSARLILPFSHFHAASGWASVSKWCSCYILVLVFVTQSEALFTQPSPDGPHSQLFEHLLRLPANISPLSPAWGDGIN